MRGGENSQKEEPLDWSGPCSVCNPTVGMIVGAEEAHCSSQDRPLSMKREMDGREEEMKATDRKRG